MASGNIGVDDIIGIIYLSTMIAIMVALTIATALSTKREKEQPARTIVVIECPNCGYSTTRLFQKGDYIGKPVGSCPRCGAQMVVSSIYAEKIEEKKAVSRRTHREKGKDYKPRLSTPSSTLGGPTRP